MKLALLGQHIGHSWSPAMQKAALDAAGLSDGTYEIIDLSGAELESRWSELRSTLLGVNVTIPHKGRVHRLCDELDDEARATGAVNTVRFGSGRATGSNTDVVGFRRALAGSAASQFGRAVIVGAGGAARAVVRAISVDGVPEIVVLARDTVKATAEFGSSIEAPVRIESWDSRARFVNDADLLIHATPLGREDEPWPIEPAELSRSVVAFDLNYAPGGTAWGRALRDHGVSTVLTGETMLLEQGALAFEFWTGLKPDRDAMARAIEPLRMA